MRRSPARHPCLALCLVLATGGCAGPHRPPAASPSQATQPGARAGGEAPPAPEPPPAATGPAARAQPSLLGLIPTGATAALVVRQGALSWFETYLAANAPVRAELSAYLLARLGVDLTRITGLVAYTLAGLEGQPSGAALLCLPGPAAPLPLPPRGNVAGLPIHQLAPGLSIARVPAGLVLGSEPEVRAALVLAQGAAPPLAIDSPLAVALGQRAEEVDVALAAGEKMLAPAQQWGLRQASLLLSRGGLITLSLRGDGGKLAAAQQLLVGLVGTGLSMLQAEKEQAKAAPDPAKAIGAILAYHGARAGWQELQPRLQGDELVSRYQLPSASNPMVIASVVGVLSAMAIPNFLQYQKKAKVVEARINLRLIADAAVAYREDHRAAGKRFAFPASTPWTPAGGCCQGGSETCAMTPDSFSSPSWRALGFSPAGPLRYQYRFVAQGRGPKARFVAEARGDLDCDGTFSSFRREGGLGRDGTVELGELVEDRALE